MGKCNSHCAYIRAGQSSENKTKSITKHIQSNEGCVCKSYFAETWVGREKGGGGGGGVGCNKGTWPKLNWGRCSYMVCSLTTRLPHYMSYLNHRNAVLLLMISHFLSNSSW